jgi:hypothetical protein
MTTENSTGPQLIQPAELRQVPIVMQMSSNLTPLPCNAFSLRVTPDGILLTAGFAVPPLFVGQPDEQRAQMESIDHIEAKPLADLLIPLNRLPYLVQMLTQTQEILETQGQSTEEKPE